jgi:hypothetical protein
VDILGGKPHVQTIKPPFHPFPVSHTLHMHLTLLPLITFVLGDIAPPPIPNCGLPPTVRCLTRNAQYTVVGTITSTNLNDPGTTATPGRFNATMNIRYVGVNVDVCGHRSLPLLPAEVMDW